MGLRELTLDEVEVELTIDTDEHGPEGCFATDEPDKDEELVREIRERVASGDVWAWCTVTVEARWNGFVGTDVLGGCSYKDEADFKEEGGYYQQMVAEALDELNRSIAEMDSRISELRSPDVVRGG